MTIVSHVYNEEYLLPFWLNHHKKYFSDGIIIDYDSTDKSVEIITSICPNWKVIKSRNSEFDAALIDQEVMDVESTISGTRICLNTTEFIVGDFSKVGGELIIPSVVMVDKENEKIEFSDLLEERTNGIRYEKNQIRGCRCMHDGGTRYSLGRHFHHPNTEDFLILWYGFSPWNKENVNRKLQIQNRISERDKRMGHGFQHLTNEESLNQMFLNYQKQSEDLSPILNKWKQ
jgi:hypothetical protein